MPSTSLLRVFKPKVLLLIVFVVTMLLTGTVISRAWNRVRAVVPAQVQSTQRERIETELITISKSGFEPAELSRPPGKFYLHMDNRSEMSLELRLNREGQTVKTHTVDLNTLEWHEELNLEPGEYVLSSPGQPEWTCRLTITAR